MESLPKNKNGKIDIQAFNMTETSEKKHILINSDDDSYQKARELLSNALDVSIDRINENSKINDLPEWNSLGHLNVVFNLSDKLGYEIDPYECLTFMQIQNALEKKSTNKETVVINKGLHGIFMDKTSICYLDKTTNKIYYRGIDLINLTENFDYLEVLSILINSNIPTEKEKNRYVQALHEGIYSAVNNMNRTYTPDVMSLVSQLLLLNDSELSQGNDTVCIASRIIGFLLGLNLKELPDDSRSIGEMVIDAFSDEHSSIEKGRLIEKCMIVLAEHGACASTTVLRGVASTDNSLISSLGAAILAFHGRKHGGAIIKICSMLEKDNGLFGNAWIEEIEKNS
ncbi:MAG: hypothetical protein GTO02_22185, partial [Candidatus Dadabacteria bacterium]|nr:hypothetical protein [Candidatus Dadabacteria bacterium]